MERRTFKNYEDFEQFNNSLKSNFRKSGKGKVCDIVSRNFKSNKCVVQSGDIKYEIEVTTLLDGIMRQDIALSNPSVFSQFDFKNQNRKYKVVYRIDGSSKLSLKESDYGSFDETRSAAESLAKERRFGILEDIEITLITAEENTEDEALTDFIFEIEGKYIIEVNAHNKDDAEKMTAVAYQEADFGELRDIKAELVEIN